MLRFTGSEINSQIDKVVDTILRALVFGDVVQRMGKKEIVCELNKIMTQLVLMEVRHSFQMV